MECLWQLWSNAALLYLILFLRQLKSSWEYPVPLCYSLLVIWAPALKLKVFSFQQPDFSPFSFFSHIPIVVPLSMRWRVYACVSVQACASVCACACAHACMSEQFDFFLFVCVWSGREGMCLFSPVPPLLSPSKVWTENKRGRRGGESAPTVDLAIVRSRNTIPIDAVDAWLKPPEALGRGLIQGLMWPAGMAAKMGVQAFVETVGTLSLDCCFHITLILMTLVSSKSSTTT